MRAGVLGIDRAVTPAAPASIYSAPLKKLAPLTLPLPAMYLPQPYPIKTAENLNTTPSPVS